MKDFFNWLTEPQWLKCSFVALSGVGATWASIEVIMKALILVCTLVVVSLQAWNAIQKQRWKKNGGEDGRDKNL
jgi:hypothetical protein